MTKADRVKAAIRDVPDFPKPGILFKDLTPVLGDAALFRAAVDLFVERLRGAAVDRVAAVDARGFLFGGAICDRLGVGLAPVRKKGKLPYRTLDQECELEYGTATLSLHEDALRPGERVALVDDLLATGGTAEAACRLIERAGGTVSAACFLVELAFLKGRERLAGYEVFAPVVF